MSKQYLQSTLFCRVGEDLLSSIKPSEKWAHLNSDDPREILEWLNTRNSYEENITNENNKDVFWRIWVENKRYIIAAYQRQSRLPQTNLQINQIAKEYFQKIKSKVIELNLRKIIFKENPHTFFDVIMMFVARNQNIEVVYFEYFLNNSIITRVSIDRGIMKQTKVNNSNKLRNFKKSVSLIKKITHILLKLNSKLFGGGVLWSSVVLDGGKYLKLNYLQKLFLSLNRERALKNFYQKFRQIKQITAEDITSRDIIVYFHFQPESSTMPYGHIYSEQIYMCLWLAKKYPKRKILMKEHPAMLAYSEKKSLCCYAFRNTRMLQRLIQQDNVRLYKTRKIIEDCWVASINGTIIGERMNLKYKTLVMENKALIKYVGRSTFFIESGDIKYRGTSKNLYSNVIQKIEEVINLEKEIL
jgi:hypothetical protein